VSGSRDATLRMWNIRSGECVHVLTGHVAAVRCVQYDGVRVVSGAYDYTVRVWDPATESCMHVLQGHTNRVYSLQVGLGGLSASSSCILSAYARGSPSGDRRRGNSVSCSCGRLRCSRLLFLTRRPGGR